MKGFAILMSLLIVLLLSVIGFSMLIVSINHFAATKNLFENENARNACYYAAFDIVNRYNVNHETPWIDQTVPPWNWNEYQLSGKLNQPWSNISNNLLTISASRGKFAAEYQVQLRQRRFEDFALFSDSDQQLPTSSLFDGLVFVRTRLQLSQPMVRFRELVNADVQPQNYASFRRTSWQQLDYPRIESLMNASSFRDETLRTGILISDKNPLFWRDDAYHFSLDDLHLESNADGWTVQYQGTTLGTILSLRFWFDDSVRLDQADRVLPFMPSSKNSVPFYIGSDSNVILDSNIFPMESATAQHPLCLVASRAIHISSLVQRQSRFSAILIALGSENLNGTEVSLLMEPGDASLSLEQKDQYVSEVQTSAFLLEEEKRLAMIQALEADEKIVWFQGSVVIRSSMQSGSDVSQIHFAATDETYTSLPSFPFVFIVEGSKRWP